MEAKILLVLSAILLLGASFFAVPAGSQLIPQPRILSEEAVMNGTPPEGVSVYPANYTFSTNTTPLNSRFNVTVWVGNVSNLYGYRVHLSYNTTLLNVTRAWIPTWHSEWVFYGESPGAGGAYPMSSDVLLMSALGGVWNFNGSGLLGIVEFEIIYVPVIGSVSSVLNLTISRLFDSNPLLVSAPPYLGDVNGDLLVDAFDTLGLAAAWLAFQGEPRYNPNADFDGDGAVLIYDFLCIVFNFDRDYNVESEAWDPQEIPVVKTNGNYRLSALIGDLNGDWTVNIFDAVILSNAFDNPPGDPGWNPNADINGDQAVDIFDAILLANNFDETWV